MSSLSGSINKVQFSFDEKPGEVLIQVTKEGKGFGVKLSKQEAEYIASGLLEYLNRNQDKP